MILAVGDPVWTVLIVGAFGILNIFAAWWMKRQDRQDAEKREDRLATATNDVATTLKATNTSFGEQLDSIAKTGEDTHTLVNANMGAALNVNRISTRRLADITNNQADIEAADKAEELYLAHERKQATVDAATGKKAQ